MTIWMTSEDTTDDFFDGHLLDINISDRQLIQKSLADGDYAIALDLEPDAARALLDDFTVLAQMLRGTAVGAGALDSDEFGIGEPVDNVAQPAIEEDFTVVDDNHPFAEFLDIG